MLSILTTIYVWISIHPQALSLIWLAATALLTGLLKPRTPEEYAAMSPRVAAFLKLLSALGIDPIKAVEALKELWAGAAAQLPIKAEEKK